MLFNLADDPGEQKELAAERPEIVKDLKARFEAWAAQTDKEAARTGA